MKKIYLLFCFLYSTFFNPHSSYAQVGEWVWLNGPDTANGLPNYGVQGVAAATNVPPAVYEACEFTDSLGNFWLFGGQGYDSVYFADLNDLWELPMDAISLPVAATRLAKVRVRRRKEIIYEGLTQSLRRFQDEVNEVRAGMECGIRIEGFSDLQVGDAIETYSVEKVAQKL